MSGNRNVIMVLGLIAKSCSLINVDNLRNEMSGNLRLFASINENAKMLIEHKPPVPRLKSLPQWLWIPVHVPDVFDSRWIVKP